MKVLLDHQIFSTQEYGGISRYAYGLARDLPQSGIDVDLGFKYSPNKYLLEDADLKAKHGYESITQKEFLPGINFRGKGRIARLMGTSSASYYDEGAFSSKQKLKEGNFDVFHPTYYDPYFLDALNGKPYVVTVYDMIHEKFAEYLPATEWPRIEQKRLMVQNASRVIAISENTKKDIVDILDVSADKIDVVHLASFLNTNHIEEIELPEKYLLYVGHRWHYKNFLMCAEVIAQLVKEDPELKLVCFGGGAFNQDEQKFFETIGLNKNVLHLGSKESILPALYTKALAFIYPSVYEGFGIPIVEAFELSCPVICAANGAFEEIAQDAAVYFAPKDWSGMKNAIKDVVYNKELRNKLIKSGQVRAKDFSPAKVAEQTAATYRRI